MANYWVVMVSYLIGSIPVSYLVARYWKGVDIRRVGSGNVGATNVWRSAGPLAGITALAGDVAKGLLAVVLARHFGDSLLVAVSALAVLAGHGWPVFLGFKGGKLVATGAGVIAAISPPVLAAAFAVWLAVVFASRYISAGSIAAAVSIPVLMFIFHLDWPYLAVGFLTALFSSYKHIPNIKRLANGTEPKVNLKINIWR
ncbi:MAG TPA: glycerol-3-phosphate 1-O-acyltransferase PlsY [Bacillota bacterium]|nr:glycerol-3-phosphate 1-O-acyltransferase PlsY [Bacillota bacterium]